MTVDEFAESIKAYQSDSGLKYGFEIISQSVTDINEENWLSYVKFKDGFDDNGFGIPCDPPMTWNDLKPFITESIKIINNKNINSLRLNEYPLISEQLDDLYHQGVFSPEMTSRIRAVKEKYPKL